MQSVVEFVTPELAERFLIEGAPNRPIRERRVEMLTGVIQRGEWRLNGETIIFDKTGHMLDGQHRCLAIIKSGIGVPSLVARGAEDGSFETIDRGVSRTNTDSLFMAGEKNYVVLSAILRLIKDIESETVSNPKMMSSAEQRQVMEKHPLAREWASRQGAIHTVLSGATQLCAVLCLMEERCGAPALEFYADIATGANLSEGSPILALRNRLVSDRSFRRGTKAMRVLLCNLIARSWNCWARGEKIQKLYENKKDTVYDLKIPGGRA